jgi:phosphatidylserine/phosphatidylglycerophosphate/cardiolipin synthase-like enzyme
MKVTKLKETEFEQALKELFQAKLLEEKEKGKFWVKRDLYGKCQSFFEEMQKTLVDWVQKWRIQERAGWILDYKLSHFYLADRLLSKFSEGLIERSKQEILVVNPFVQRCHISDLLMLMSGNGIDVKLVARSISPEQFRGELLAKGVFFTYDESIHAKLVVVDRTVGIVSSMNFYAGSTAGASWEAGLVTVDKRVVNTIVRSIYGKIKSHKASLC